MEKAKWLKNGAVAWDSFNAAKWDDKYLASVGEGESKASQIAAAGCKLIYKHYNDGDVYDNTHYLSGWANDLSSYANWLNKNLEGASEILGQIQFAEDDDQYEQILWHLSELIDKSIDKFANEPTVGSIYDCDGPFHFEEYTEEEEENYEDDFDPWAEDDESVR